MTNGARGLGLDTRSRTVTFGMSTIRIDAVGAVAADLVGFLFGDIPEDGGPAPHVTLRVAASGDGSLTLSSDEGGWRERGTLAEMASSLLERATFHLCDASRGGAVLHAAAVVRHGRCLLFPGQSGAGKSTLTAWLVSKGFTYLTDELVYVPTGTRDVRPFPRPLNIKTAGISALDGPVLDLRRLASRILEGPRVTLVPASVLDPAGALRSGMLAGIIFPRFKAGASLAVTRLSKAQTGLALMGCCVNARNLEAHGFPQVTALATSIPACTLTYGGFAQLGDWVGQVTRPGGIADGAA